MTGAGLDRLLRSSIGIVVIALVVSGCSLTQLVPNMDAGSAGCQRASGIGPTPAPDEPAAIALPASVMPELHGKSPAQAKALAEAQGHTVVFNVEGACWCVAPPGGTVTESWWNQHGALYLRVSDFPSPAEDPPFLGWGC
jgi:hypothetical protein